MTHRFARLRQGTNEAEDDGKEGWLTLLQPDGSTIERSLAPYAFGYPNILEGLAIHSNNIWVTHLLNSPELPRTFETTVSAGLTALPINSESSNSRQLHINDADFSTPVNFPRAVAVAPDGKSAYLVLTGTNAVMGVDLSISENPKLLGFWPVGDNPRGIVLSPDASTAYVMNYLSRDISVLDLSDQLRRPELVRIPTTVETLKPEVLRGKLLFNNANDPRLSRLGWLSCASCHPDGGSDGTTWVTPEGRRQTIPLWALEGTAPFHASATRDELQDFEDDIETLMNGVGLAPGPVGQLLGEPNGGTSKDLDALAAFILQGIRAPRAAKPDAALLQQGREIFEKASCATCHGGPNWTVSRLPGDVGTLAPDGESEVEAVLRDVGTYSPKTDVFGSEGFDVPGLLGLSATAPYLHDGSAKHLEDILRNPQHVITALTSAEMAKLIAFLMSVDNETTPFSVSQ